MRSKTPLLATQFHQEPHTWFQLKVEKFPEGSELRDISENEAGDAPVHFCPVEGGLREAPSGPHCPQKLHRAGRTQRVSPEGCAAFSQLECDLGGEGVTMAGVSVLLTACRVFRNSV